MGIKKFFKKNLRDIATVVGFAVGGPAGAAIGQGIGSAAEGRDLGKSLTSAAKVYGGANIAAGAGLQGGGGSISFGPAQAGQGGVGGFFQDIGAGARNIIGGDATFADVFGKEGTLATSYGDLGMLQKAGVIGTGLAGLGAFDPMETGNVRMPGATSTYLTQGLRPAVLSDVYGTAGIPTVGGSAMPGGSMDPISQTYLELLAKNAEQDYGNIAFPTFQQSQVLASKDGGIARLADGGAMPEVDLRMTGGGLKDPMGSGNKDTIPALLADGEFVMTKQAVKGIGDGNHDKGIAMLYAMMDNNEKKAQRMGLGRA